MIAKYITYSRSFPKDRKKLWKSRDRGVKFW